MPERGRVGRRWRDPQERLDVVLSLVVFVVVSLLAFVVALRFVDGVAWPAVIGVFCGFAAATVLNVTDVMARRKGRDSTGGETGTGGRDDQRGTAAYLSLVADPGE